MKRKDMFLEKSTWEALRRPRGQRPPCASLSERSSSSRRKWRVEETVPGRGTSGAMSLSRNRAAREEAGPERCSAPQACVPSLPDVLMKERREGWSQQPGRGQLCADSRSKS